MHKITVLAGIHHKFSLHFLQYFLVHLMLVLQAQWVLMLEKHTVLQKEFF